MPLAIVQHRLPSRTVLGILAAVLVLGTFGLYHTDRIPDVYHASGVSSIPQHYTGDATDLESLTGAEPPLPPRTKFLFAESRFPPPSAPFEQKPEQEPIFDFDVSPVKEPGMVVPNAVHFVWPSAAPIEDVEANMGRSGESEVFPYYAYLSIRSALLVLKPHRIYFHYTLLPTGPWFDALKPHLTLNQVPTPTRVYDQWLEMPAHRSDVLRIMVLRKLGGIYLDLDMYLVRPFDEFMWAPFTLGVEAYPGSGGVPKGLCNAVIVSAVNATFLEPWMRSYMEFRHDLYEYNGIIKPWYIARFDHSLVQVVTHEAFFNPTWDDNELTMVHETNDWDWDASGQCAYHAWKSVRPEYMRDLNPHTVRKAGNSFDTLVKRYMGDEDEAIWDSLRH